MKITLLACMALLATGVEQLQNKNSFDSKITCNFFDRRICAATHGRCSLHGSDFEDCAFKMMVSGLMFPAKMEPQIMACFEQAIQEQSDVYIRSLEQNRKQTDCDTMPLNSYEARFCEESEQDIAFAKKIAHNNRERIQTALRFMIE